MFWKMFASRKVQFYCSAVFLFLFSANPAVVGATATRQHGAHVHGIGNLDVALDGKMLVIELKSPAANIVGFEHAPETETQKHALHEAKKRLEAGEKVFILSERAQCRLHGAHVENDMEELHEAHERHRHDEMKEEHHEKHDEHHHDASHDGHHHVDGAVHSDFEAAYYFDCAHPENLKSMIVELFSQFPGFEKIQVQLLTPQKQTGLELTKKKNKIDF